MLRSSKIFKSGYLAIMIILLVLGLAGCTQGGSYKLIMGDIQAGEKSIEGSYSSFSGNYYKNVELAKNDQIIFGLTAETEAGKIAAQLIDPDGNIILEIKEGSRQEKFLEETGTYKMKVIGEDHKGNFELSWAKKLF